MKLSGTGPAHRLDECEISVQEQRISGGVQGPAKPAAVGFTADKPASGSRPFECCTIDHSDNSPYLFFLAPACKTLGQMRDFGARTAIFRRGARPRKARRCGIRCGQTGQWVTPFRVLHHRPLGQLSIFIFSGTGLQDPRTNARFRCKNSDFQAGCKAPQSPPLWDSLRTNRPVGHALSSATSSTS